MRRWLELTRVQGRGWIRLEGATRRQRFRGGRRGAPRDGGGDPSLDSVGMAPAHNEDLRTLAQRVAEALPPKLVEKVVLTGSVSRGIADELSDMATLKFVPKADPRTAGVAWLGSLPPASSPKPHRQRARG